MRLRWYQSRLFWLGLGFLILLMSVWTGFVRTSSNLTWSDGRMHYGFAFGEGKFELFSHQHLTTYGNSFGGGDLLRGLGARAEKGVKYESVPLEAAGVEFFPPAFGGFNYGVPGRSNVARFHSVGQWVIVLAVFVLWMGAMIWNQRRKRKWLADQKRWRPQMDADAL